MKASADEEIAEARKLQTQRERKLDRREEQLQHQEDSLVKQQRGLETSQTRLATQNQKLADLRSRLEKTLQQQVEILERASGMSKDEASQQLMKALESELESERGAVLLHHKRRLSEVVKEQGREMLLTAIQRYSSTHTAETTTSTIDVPTDDIKGRIIGREGRNIRAFEKATGVDVIIDDTPGVVIVSGFDPVRREVARLSLSTLISDGRIHPAKIEEVVAETNKKIESVILQKGREAADEVNVSGLHDKVLRMLGRLHFRTSYSQNVLRHSIEVAFVSGLVAEMLGMDGDLARRCGLLHDIGKAADHELEGGHPKIGADLLRRHKEAPEVVHAAYGHHDEVLLSIPIPWWLQSGMRAVQVGQVLDVNHSNVTSSEWRNWSPLLNALTGVRQAFAISCRTRASSHRQQ